MAYFLAFLVLASFLDLIGLTVLMWAVGKDLTHHDLRIFNLEIREKTQAGQIEDLQHKLDETHRREEAHS